MRHVPTLPSIVSTIVPSGKPKSETWMKVVTLKATTLWLVIDMLML